MSKYNTLTKYISLIEHDEEGKWIIDTKGKGIHDSPIQMPFVSYSRAVYSFIDDLYKFCEDHPEYDHTNYRKTLNEYGIEWSDKSMENANVTTLDDKAIIALLIGVTRADRFCEGTLMSYFRKGIIKNWLLRLEELDN